MSDMAEAAEATEMELKAAWLSFHCEVLGFEVTGGKLSAGQEKTIMGGYNNVSQDYRTSILPLLLTWSKIMPNLLAAEMEVVKAQNYARPEAYNLFDEADLTDEEVADLEERPTMLTYLKHQMNYVQQLDDYLAVLDRLGPAMEEHVPEKKLKNYVANERKEKAKDLESNKTSIERLKKEKDEYSAATQRLLDWKRERYSLSPAWFGTWPLGAGSQGETNLWVRQRSNGTIADRVVLKRCHMDKKKWNDTKMHWWVDPRNKENRVPNEVATMVALRSRIGAETTIMRIRTWGLDAERNDYTIYMEFAPHGDLGEWTKWWWERDTDATAAMNVKMPGMEWSEARKAALKVLHGKRETLNRIWLPEPFLWSVFEALATAGHLMDEGDLEGDPLGLWTPILHLDIKAQNVMLGLPANSRFCQYPTVRLGDFGFARFFPRDAKEFEYFLGCGTYYLNPAEQISKHRYPGETEPRRPDSRTNVFGVGIVLWSLVEFEDGDHRLQFDNRNRGHHDFDPELLLEPAFRQPAKIHYSKELLDLISKCCRYEQKDRPTFSELLRSIRRHTKPGSKRDRAAGLRDAPADSPLWREEHKLQYPQDRFPLNSDLKVVPLGLARAPGQPALEEDSDSDEVGGGPEVETLTPQRRTQDCTSGKKRSSPTAAGAIEQTGSQKKSKTRDGGALSRSSTARRKQELQRMMDLPSPQKENSAQDAGARRSNPITINDD